ncbi:MAG: hypothetical protein GY847_09625 [Proteobacteria bacterium]|nr:hypothetical protein [Pseudomonadota bacterium]
MTTEDDYLKIEIKKRPWWAWLGWGGWLFWLIFWADYARGSLVEIERRAFYVAATVFLFSLFGGLVTWHKRAHRADR